MIKKVCPSLFVISVFLIVLHSPLTAAKTTDVVYLKIGSTMIGEIKGVAYGRVKFDTDQMGEVNIEWNKIAHITSPHNFEIELNTGQRFFGSLGKTSDEEELVITTAEGSVVLDMDSVVFLTPIGAGFWQRITASIDLGFSYTKSREVVQWQLGADATYDTRNRSFELRGSWFFSDQKDVKKTSRSNLGFTYMRTFRNRWFGAGLSNLEQNDELGLALRSMLGITAGRQLIQSSKSMLAASAGVVLTQEDYKGADPSLTSAEGLIFFQFMIFRFEERETDLSTGLSVYPSLTSWGRVRTEFNGRFRLEIIKDLFWSMRVYYSYDSNPPTSASSKDDYGVTTSVGWTW